MSEPGRGQKQAGQRQAPRERPGPRPCFCVGAAAAAHRRCNMRNVTAEEKQRFVKALEELDERFSPVRGKLLDEKADDEVRRWLDGNDEPLPWAGPGVTPDEWFFITTLYGEMTLPQQ